MKGEKAEYKINLPKAFMFPVTKRVRKALSEIKAFVKKHARVKDTAISNEVNEFIHKNSKNIPRGINAVLLKEDKRVIVFLQGGKQLDAYTAKKAQEKKKKEEKKAAKESQNAKESKDSAEADDEKKRRLEEKKTKEDASKALEHKR